MRGVGDHRPHHPADLQIRSNDEMEHGQICPTAEKIYTGTAKKVPAEWTRRKRAYWTPWEGRSPRATNAAYRSKRGTQYNMIFDYLRMIGKNSYAIENICRK